MPWNQVGREGERLCWDSFIQATGISWVLCLLTVVRKPCPRGAGELPPQWGGPVWVREMGTSSSSLGADRQCRVGAGLACYRYAFILPSLMHAVSQEPYPTSAHLRLWEGHRPHSKVRKQRPREAKPLAKGHIAGECGSPFQPRPPGSSEPVR